MSAQEFVYWLQGFLEIAKPETISAEQVQEIKNHIKLVLTKITPEAGKSIGWLPLGIPQNNTVPSYEVTWVHTASC